MARYPTLRQSRLASFDSCALESHFDEQYRRDWSTYPAALGSLLHRVFAKCLMAMAEAEEDSIEPDVALAILAEVIRQHDVDDFCHEPGCDLPANTVEGRVTCAEGHDHRSSLVNLPMAHAKDAVWQVRKWANENRYSIGTLISIEERLEGVIEYPDPEGGFVQRRVTGALDALFQDPDDEAHAIVIDYKTGWALPPPTSLSFEGYFQQRLYSWAVMKTYPSVRRVTTRESYTRKGEMREGIMYREDLPRIEEEFSALVERFDRAYETQNFPPTPGSHCAYCPRPTACPIPAFVRGEGRITDAEQAAKVAAQLLTAEVIVKQTKGALSAWADLTGPIAVKDGKADRVYGHRKSEKVMRPDREQVAHEVEMARLEGREVNLDGLYRKMTGTKFEQYAMPPEQRPEAQDADLLASIKASLA